MRSSGNGRGTLTLRAPDLAGAVGGNVEAARDLAEGIGSSKNTIEELAEVTRTLGMNNKAGEASAVAGEADGLSAQAAALADALDQLRARIQALAG